MKAPFCPIASAVAHAVLVGAGAALFLAAFAVPIFLYPTLRPNLPPKASIDFLPYIPVYTSGIMPRQSTIWTVFAKRRGLPRPAGRGSPLCTDARSYRSYSSIYDLRRKSLKDLHEKLNQLFVTLTDFFLVPKLVLLRHFLNFYLL